MQQTRIEVPQCNSRELKQERSLGTRKRLVNAAMRLICERGYAAVSTQLVAVEAGVSRGALQYHFASRDALFLAVRSRLAELLHSHIPPADLTGMPTRARVQRLVAGYWAIIGSDDYVAAIEIRLNERFNGRLHALLTTEMRGYTETRDREWVSIFADATASPAESVSARRFMLDALRGFALRRLEEGPRTDLSPELATLVRTLTMLLASR